MSLDTSGIYDIMSKDVKVESQNQNILAVSKVMSDNNIGSVIIVDNHESKNPVGIVTERDIIRILGSLKQDLMQTPIKDLMSYPIIPLSAQATVADALTLMQEKEIRRIPIVDKDNKLVGIVTESDIIRLLIKNIDLLPSFANDNTNIVQKPLYNDFLRYYSENTFPKRS